MKHDKLTQAILAKANTMPAARPFPTKDRPGIKLNKPKAWQFPINNILSPSDGLHTKLAKDSFPDLVTTSEKDPNGKDLNSPGAKADAGKTRGWLCLAGFSRALEEVAKVTTVGANKYTPNGWVDVPDGPARYMDAFVRHTLALGQGEVMDDGPSGTGCYHKAAMIWNLLASFELELREST